MDKEANIGDCIGSLANTIGELMDKYRSATVSSIQYETEIRYLNQKIEEYGLYVYNQFGEEEAKKYCKLFNSNILIHKDAMSPPIKLI